MERYNFKIVEEKWLIAKARFGIFPANSVGDDIEVYSSEDRKNVLVTWLSLRQQLKKTKNQPNIALADFIAPKVTEIKDSILNYNRLNPNLSFDNFVEGKSNDIALSYSKKVCEHISRYNPLYICGGVGLAIEAGLAY